MAAPAGPDSSAGVFQYARVAAWYLVPVGLVAAFAIIGVLLVSSLGSSEPDADGARAEEAARKLAPYWTVRAGQTYSQIAQKTGLSIEQLQTFNPRTDPTTLVPGQRLKLRLHVPVAPPKPLGPRFWKVRSGQSFGSIAASTGVPIDRLQRLNRRLKPTALQPGDRVRLRR